METRSHAGAQPDEGRDRSGSGVDVGYQRARPVVERREHAYEPSLSQILVRPHGAGFVVGHPSTLPVGFMNRRMPNGTSVWCGRTAGVIPPPTRFSRLCVLPNCSRLRLNINPTINRAGRSSSASLGRPYFATSSSHRALDLVILSARKSGLIIVGNHPEQEAKMRFDWFSFVLGVVG